MVEVVARWESKSGKHYVEIYVDSTGYGYTSSNGGGCMGQKVTEEEAIKQIERRVNDFQPDSNKTPMRRVI